MVDDAAPTPARILVVDDTPANIDVLRSMLESEGHSVSFATSGTQALKLASRLAVDLILLDVMMPEMDGYETCQRLKAQEATRDVPVIFVTAKTETADIVRGFEVGAVDYVPKPFRREEVCARVRTQLRLRSLMLQQVHQVNLERKRLRQIQEIFDTVEDGILTLDADGYIQSVNPGCEKLLGAPSIELVGRHVQEVLRPATEPEASGVHQHPGGPVQAFDVVRCGHYEVVGGRGNGGIAALELCVSQLHSNHFPYVAVLHDISGHKATEHELLEMSRTDHLTDLPNLRGFRERVELEWRRALRNQVPLSMLMIDIDFFKRYNDSLGHVAGNECLRKVAQAIRDCCLRASDLPARYGGEEFAVVLPGTEEQRAGALAERIRSRVQGLGLKHPASEVADVVTISLGMATVVPDPASSVAMLVSMADRALYQAKAAGRNRVAH